MTSVNDPLQLPCGQVLPTRIMKAAMSEALGDKTNARTSALSGCTRPGARAATGYSSPAM